jgi:hypothetical protein
MDDVIGMVPPSNEWVLRNIYLISRVTRYVSFVGYRTIRPRDGFAQLL